jgi:peptidoglycan hydrolase-like protein with peptidoglycan-binding domain
MKTFAVKEKRSAPAIRRSQPSRFGYRGPEVKAQQLEIRRILRSTEARGLNRARSSLQIQRSTLKNRSKIGRTAVVVALRAQPQIFRQAVLSSARAARAVQYNNYYYDPKSIIIIENIVNVTPNGHFSLSDAQAVATYQQNTAGLGTDGMVGENTLNVMVPELARTGAHSEAISLVVDYYNVNLQETLSIRYDANISGTRISFESGYLHVIRIGPQAFRRATDLLNAISNTMSTTAPGHMAMHVPRRLSRTQVRGAIRANKRRFQDTRSILAIQELVQVPISGVIDADTSQNIAEFQYNRGLTQNPDGRIDSRRTLQAMVSELKSRRHYNSVIRLIIDYFNLSTHGALLDISFGPRTTLAGWIPGTTTLRIGQVWFRRSFAALVHQIAHMLDRVRTRKAGILDRAVRVFLGEAVEILSIGTPEEAFRNFMLDARRALVNWNNMSKQDRRRYWVRFHHVRAKVYQRYSIATLAQRRAYNRLLRAYISVMRP